MATVKINENQLDLTNTTSAINAEVAARESAVSALSSSISTKQDTLTAGANIVISGGTISATDTTYTAGDNIVIGSGNVISAVVSGSAYELPPATAASLGGIKVGSGLSVTSDGTLSTSGGGYVLPEATTSSLGGVIVGSGLTVSSGVISTSGGSAYTLPPATTSSLGGLIVGSGLSVTSDGTVSVSGGGVSGDYLPISGGTMVPSSGSSDIQIDFDTAASMYLKADDDKAEMKGDGAIYFESYSSDIEVLASSNIKIYATSEVEIGTDDSNVEVHAGSGHLHLKVDSGGEDLDIVNDGDGNINIATRGTSANINVETESGGAFIYNGGNVLTTNDVSVMSGATSSSAGTSGLVPAPTSADYDKYLKGDGTWGAVSSGGGGGADITYDIENEQLVIETDNVPSFVNLENLSLGDRVNNVASFVTYFTDGDNKRYAVFVLDAIYRTLSGTDFSTDTSVISGYNTSAEALAVKDTATYTTDTVFSKTTPSTSSYSSFYYARNPGGTAFTTTVNGMVCKSQLPNLFELNEIFTNRVALNAVDPTNTEDTNLADWDFSNAAVSNAIGAGGGRWVISKSDGIKNRAGSHGVIPVLEIPVVSPNVNTIKLDNNVLQVKNNSYTKSNLLAGDNISIEEKAQEGVIDDNTISLWHFDDSDKNEITGNNSELEGISTFTTGKFNKAAAGLYNGTLGYSGFSIDSDSDFTFDFWGKFPSNGSFFYIQGGYKEGIGFYRTSSTQMDVYYGFSSKGSITISDAADWNHYAIQRKSGYYDCFVNGNEVTLSEPLTDTWSKGWIYGWGRSNGIPCDELRVSNVARYNGNFTPLTKPYIAIDPSAEKQYEIKANCADKSLSNLTASGQQAIVNYAMPDYANVVTVGPLNSGTYTQVTKDSFVIVRANDPFTTDSYLYVSPDNGTTKYVVGWWHNDINANVKGSSWSFFVPKGWYFTSEVENPYTAYIYPLKGAQ